MVCVGDAGLIVPQAAAALPAPRSRLSDPIPKPPSTNEPRVEANAPAWLQAIPYPRAALSSFVFNISAVMIYVPMPQRAPMGGPASVAVVTALLHTMGLLSLANWTMRTEWARLADISCMLVLKITFIALALGLESADDSTFLTVIGVGTFLSVDLIFR